MLPKGSSQRVCAPKDNMLHPRCGYCFVHLQQCATVSKDCVSGQHGSRQYADDAQGAETQYTGVQCSRGQEP